MKNEKVCVNKRKKGGALWVVGCFSFAVLTLIACQFIFVNDASDNATFLNNTTINGIDVSGMTQKQAENILSYNLLKNRDKIKLELIYGDKNWSFSGSDFEVANDIEYRVNQALEVGREGNFFEKRKTRQKIEKEGLNLNISYKTALGGVDQKIDDVISQINQEYQEPQVVFNPDKEEKFSIVGAKNEIRVDREKLLKQIDEDFAVKMTAKIEIPTIENIAETDEMAILSNLGLRSKYITNYAKSNNNRKFNIQKALKCFNGMVVNPSQEVSFNKTTGPRSTENGYKKANIILNGAYVEGAGGGVCQASTTLYNAVLLSGLDVVEKSNHSLPASYVPLSFDAMVTEDTSDMVFVNNYDFPVYIRTYCTDSDVVVEIYGNKFESGKEIRTRALLVRVLPHEGDKIIPDTNLEYSNYIIYKGEYHRVKYPKEGYESKAFIQFLQDGEVVEERELRHDFYLSQTGIIAEGVEDVPDGITLPKNEVEFIPPQKITKD